MCIKAQHVKASVYTDLAALDRELVIVVEDAAGGKVGHVETLLHGHISEVEDSKHVSANALHLHTSLPTSIPKEHMHACTFVHIKMLSRRQYVFGRCMSIAVSPVVSCPIAHENIAGADALKTAWFDAR